MKTRQVIIIALLFCITATPSIARAADWVFQVASGSAYSFNTPLNIDMDEGEDIDITAEYETRALSTMAPYYDLRIGRWVGDHAWEFESLHHKIFLTNTPDDVQKFAISHGYNLNTINYAFLWNAFVWRFGAGVVMTHPETRIRGQRHEDDGGFNGFYLSGITSQAAVEKRFALSEKWFLSLEAKLTGSYAVVPVAGGDATVPNVALHGLLGIGYRF